MRRIASLITLLCLALPATAGAQVYDDNPATATRGAGDAWVFARAADGQIVERHLASGAWTPWASLGGVTTSGPAAAALGNTIYVFVRAGDGTISQNANSGSGWSGWRGLGGGATTSGPAAVQRRGRQYIDLAARGGSNQMWLRTFTAGSGWSGWVAHGGTLTAGFAINSPVAGDFNVWGRGTDAAVKVISFDGNKGTGWSDWRDWGAKAVGAPAAVSRAAGIQNIYVRGTDNAVYGRGISPSSDGWNAWHVLDARPVSSSPAAAGDGEDHEWVVARAGGTILYKDWRSGRGWAAWQDLGAPAVATAPAPAPTPAPTPTPPATPGPVDIQAATGCTIHGERLRVRISVKQVKGKMVRVTFFTKGKGRTVRTDKKAPFDVRLRLNRPAGSKGRVYARLYYKRNGHMHRKTVSGRYTVCP